jgi:hypothetical protein
MARVTPPPPRGAHGGGSWEQVRGDGSRGHARDSGSEGHTRGGGPLRLVRGDGPPWGTHSGEVGAAATSDHEDTHEAAAPWGAHDDEVAAAATADPGGHERDSVSLRCTRQRPLKLRTTVRWDGCGGATTDLGGTWATMAPLRRAWRRGGSGWCDGSWDAHTRGSTPERIRLRCHPRWERRWRTSLGASDDDSLP